MELRRARRSASSCIRMMVLADAIEEAVKKGDFFLASWGDRLHFKSIKLVRLIRARAPEHYHRLLYLFNCESIQCLSLKISTFLTSTLFKNIDGKALWASNLATALRENSDEWC